MNNYLTTIPGDIRFLDLSYKFKSGRLPDLSRFSNLEELRCYKMDLTTIDVELPKSLIKIDLSDNKFEEIPQAILDLPNLTEFYICSNNLKEIPNKVSPKLKIFDCSFNDIESIPNSIYKWNLLEKFYMESNKISYIPKCLPNSLKELYVSDNPIKELPNNLPTYIKVIEALDCPLIRFPYYIPYNIEKFLYTMNSRLLKLYPEIKDYDYQYFNLSKNTDNKNFKNKIKYINKRNQFLCETKNYCSNYLH